MTGGDRPQEDRSIRNSPPQNTSEERVLLAQAMGIPNPDTIREQNMYSYPGANGERLMLRIITGGRINSLWTETNRSPVACYRTKFKKKPLPPIEKKTQEYITGVYVTRRPVVKIELGDLEKHISKHFKLKELVRIDPADKARMQKIGAWDQYRPYMHEYPANSGEYYWKYAKIDPNLAFALDAMRDYLDFPITINEGVRPYFYNRDMYLAKGEDPKLGSAHNSGKAVDINRTGDPEKDRRLIEAAKLVLDGKGGGVGTYGRNKPFHFDIMISPTSTGYRGSWIKRKGQAVLRTRTW